LFGRNKPAPVETTPVKEGGKGHATPSRKQAEAAAKARAKTPRTRREKAEAMRAERQKVVNAQRSGDERYMAERDKGPVRRFLRDYIDSRVNIGEVLLPILVIAVALFYVGDRSIQVFGELVTLSFALVTFVNLWSLRFKVRRELRIRFGSIGKGDVRYALMRSTNMRVMRYPKPTVKIGTELPPTYK
jgi:hypothetical protein